MLINAVGFFPKTDAHSILIMKIFLKAFRPMGGVLKWGGPT